MCLHDYAIHYTYRNYHTKLHRNWHITSDYCKNLWNYGKFGRIVFMEFKDFYRMVVHMWMKVCIKSVQEQHLEHMHQTNIQVMIIGE